jgi:hypothetical protein
MILLLGRTGPPGTFAIRSLSGEKADIEEATLRKPDLSVRALGIDWEGKHEP